MKYESVHPFTGVHQMSATANSMLDAISQLVQLSGAELKKRIGEISLTSSTALPPGILNQPSSPEFDQWFGSSVVRSADGKPQVVYHGTSKDFRIFQPSRSGWYGRGMYFTSNPEEAEEFASGDEDGDALMPVYLSIQNPYYYNELPWWKRNVDEETNYQIVRDLLPPEEAERLINKLEENPAAIGDELQNVLASRGYDGIVIKASANHGNTEYVVFRPEQIKSSIGNRGTYDAFDPDITHSIGIMNGRSVTQALYDPNAFRTYFLVDNIPSGKEAAVFLHEIVHRHGRAALPSGRFEDLVQQLKGWAQRAEGTIERTVHDAAAARVATAGVAGPLADEELFAYAVEEAVARGVTPSAAAVEGSAQAWLHAVEQSLLHVLDKLLGNDQVALDAQDLVDLAYGLAQIDPHALVFPALRAQGPAGGTQPGASAPAQGSDNSPTPF